MVCLGADPVDAFEDAGDANDPQFEGALTGKIHQHQPHENGEQALTGECEHGDSSYNENKTQQVLQGHGGQTKNGMLPFEAFFRSLSVLEEIILAHANDYKGSDEQRQDKHGDRNRHHPGKEGLVLVHPLLDHREKGDASPNDGHLFFAERFVVFGDLSLFFVAAVKIEAVAESQGFAVFKGVIPCFRLVF